MASIRSDGSDPSVRASWATRLGIFVSLVCVTIVIVIEFTAADRRQADHEVQVGEALDELIRSASDLQTIAVDQVLSVKALMETAGDVSQNEFDGFVAVSGSHFDGMVGFAPRVGAEGLEAFQNDLSAGRLTTQYRETAVGDLPGTSGRWPVQYSSDTEEPGFQPGFDLQDEPAVAQAIKRAIGTMSPVSSRFVQLPGDDDDGGDLLIVVAVNRGKRVEGMALVAVRLDELLAERLTALLGPNAELRLVQGGADVPSIDPYTQRFEFKGLGIEMSVNGDDLAPARSWLDKATLILGLFLSGMVGMLTTGAVARARTSVDLAKLQEVLAEKDRFLASVSHELRTPLTSVIGLLHIMQDDDIELEEGEQRSLMSDALDGAEDLERLVEDYLTAARLSAGALTIKSAPVDLDELVRRACQAVNVPARITLTIGELGHCVGDYFRIRQIVRNVVRNACRYGQSRILIRAIAGAGTITIVMSNDGDPIDEAVIDRLFQPFSGSTRAGQPESIGLGLAISRDLARRMDGDLTYRPGAGWVSFDLTLPAVPLLEGSFVDHGARPIERPPYSDPSPTLKRTTPHEGSITAVELPLAMHLPVEAESA